MKKLVATFAVTSMATLGLVGLADSASAACDPKYNKCEDTNTKVGGVEADVNDKGAVRVTAQIKIKAPGVKEKDVDGTLFTTCSGPDGAKKDFETKVDGDKKFEINFRLPSEGRWDCTSSFIPKDPKEIGPSSSSFTVDI